MVINVQYSIVFNPFWGCLIPGRVWFAWSNEDRRNGAWSGSGDDPVAAIGQWIIEVGSAAFMIGKSVSLDAQIILSEMGIDWAAMRGICIHRPNLGAEVLERARELGIEINILPPYGEPERMADEEKKKLGYRVTVYKLSDDRSKPQ